MHAQNSVSGKVTDTNSHPLYGVEVYVSYLHKGTSTDEKGNFTLKNIPNGKNKISFSFLGYKTFVKTIVFSSENKTITVQLEEAVFNVDEVIVSTVFSKLQSENVVKVDRLSAKSIQKMGVATLSEGITTIPGVSQIATGTSIGKPVIRGLSGNRVLVYTQGIRLENQQFGGEHGLGINEAGIEGVEVIKGPASLLYGSDALGGVLYIQPEKFALENSSNLDVSQQFFSNTLGSNTSLGFKSTKNNWKLLARGTYGFHSDYKIPTAQRVTNSRFKEADFKAGLGFGNPSFSSELRYNFNRSNLGLPEEITTQSSSTDLEEPFQKIDNHIVSLHNHFFFGTSKLDIDFGYTFNDRSEFEEEEHGHVGAHDAHEEAAMRLKLKTFTYNVKYYFPEIKRIETVFGVQGLHQTNTNLGEELLIPNAKISDVGFFITANRSWNKNSVQAGVRFDNRAIQTEKHVIVHDGDTHVFNPIDTSFHSFTYSLGFKTLIFDTLQTRINFSSGFRAPNLAELTSNGVHHGTNRFELGNNDLKYEKNAQIDISFAYETTHFEVFANGFYNKLDDYIYISPTGDVEDGSPVFKYIQENAKLYGGEFGVHFHPHPLDWLHLKSTFETVVGKQKNGNYLPLIPANTWKNTLKTSFKLGDWLQEGYASLSLQSTFNQKNISAFETNSDAYNLVHFGFGGDVVLGTQTFNTSISVRNLFDKKYINHLSRLKADGILNQGRNIVLGLRFKI